MGEYAKLKGLGTEIKIGTCEDMLYLRFDQRHLVWPQHGNVDPIRDQNSLRYRFPWPDEDKVGPGEFRDPFRHLWVSGVTPPDDLEHGHVQFTADGYNVCIPCPEGPDTGHGLRVNRNGFAGPIALVQQRVWEGRLVGVMECRCGRRYRMPTLEDAQPVIDAIRARGGSFVTIADRLADGYTLTID